MVARVLDFDFCRLFSCHYGNLNFEIECRELLRPNRKNYRTCRVVSQLTEIIGSEGHEAQFNPTLYRPSSFILGLEILKSSFTRARALSLQSSLCHASQTLNYSCYDQTWARREKTCASMATNAMTFLRVKMENVMGMSSDSIEIYPPRESRDQPNSQMRRNWSSIVVGEQSRFCRSSDPTSNSIAAANGQTHSPAAPAATMHALFQ